MPVARSQPPLLSRLSARLLVLTAGFVMLAEVLVYVPSMARFRVDWLEERLAAAHLASLVVMASPDGGLSSDMARALLSEIGAHFVALRRPGYSAAIMADEPPMPDMVIDLRHIGVWRTIAQALATLQQDEDRVLRVVGVPPREPHMQIEMLIDEAPLRAAMIAYSGRILLLSLFISLLTAGLVFLSLQWLMVRPMRRVTASMVAFRHDPENASTVIANTKRPDEIGMVQRELAAMQSDLRFALRQKTRMALLGGAVTKINHDLRNILSSAVLISDRLSESDDPDVKRAAPKLIAAIDRAVRLCGQTMKFARDAAPAPRLSRFQLRALVAEVGEALGAGGVHSQWDNQVPERIEVDADRDQLFRALINLGNNAFEAGSRSVRIEAARKPRKIVIDVLDDGPGLAPTAHERLFQPFVSSTRAGGTGLGLVIVRDLLRAHGGNVVLVQTGATGTHFRLELPLRGNERLDPE